MEVKRNRVGVVTFLTPDFALLGDEMQRMDQEVRNSLEKEELRLVIDLHHVPYIDSAGLEKLVRYSEQIRRRGGNIKLSNPNPLLNEILEVTRMTRYFDIFFDLEKAARSFL